MACVALMVFIGGVTRLTESGLSIVEWKLFDGILPPFNEAQWHTYFTEYQTSPEFQKINSDFGLSEFKRIFWLEYIHRVLGRITGLVFLLPLIGFAITRTISKPLGWRMFGIGLLVAMQGVVGWVMVASGLVDDPRVSPLKLSMHLTLAFAIFACTLWVYLQQFHAQHRYESAPRLYYGARLLLGLTFIQVILGAWVAGWDAGLIYNSYPLMDGEFIPSGLFPYDGFWANVTGYIPLIQFQHRMGAKLLILGIFAFAYFGWRYTKRVGDVHILKWLILVITLQFALGVLTLIYVIPLTLASAHQMVALLLLAVLTVTCHRFSKAA